MSLYKSCSLLIITIIVSTLVYTQSSKPKELDTPHPFSFSEIEPFSNLIQKPHFIKAQDGIPLAYYPFLPLQPKAIIIFYHGSGLWSNGPYQHMAQELSNNQIATYLTDIRGHGNSGGPRGDAPSTQQVWDDINTLINIARTTHPQTPIFLAGHSSGAGLILNYSAYREHPEIQGYLFLSPFLGGRSSANRTHKNPAANFVKDVRLWAIIPHVITGGRLFNHTSAIFFNYPTWVYEQDPLVLPSYSCAMSAATSPSDAKILFSNLNKPFGLIIGSKDEQFLPKETLAYGALAERVYNQSTMEIIENATHLSSIIAAPVYFNKTIENIYQPHDEAFFSVPLGDSQVAIHLGKKTK